MQRCAMRLECFGERDIVEQDAGAAHESMLGKREERGEAGPFNWRKPRVAERLVLRERQPAVRDRLSIQLCTEQRPVDRSSSLAASRVQADFS